MKRAVTHGLDDTYIDKAWRHTEMEEIENLAAEILGKAQEGQSIEDDLFAFFTWLSDAASKRAIG
jgi:hypothetical protein